MEDKTDFIFEDKKFNRANSNYHENIKKNIFISNITNSKIFNFILFEIIFLLLPNKIRTLKSIEIKVNKIGYNQIFGDEYTAPIPDRIIFNDRPLLILNKIIYVQSLGNSI